MTHCLPDSIRCSLTTKALGVGMLLFAVSVLPARADACGERKGDAPDVSCGARAAACGAEQKAAGAAECADRAKAKACGSEAKACGSGEKAVKSACADCPGCATTAQAEAPRRGWFRWFRRK